MEQERAIHSQITMPLASPGTTTPSTATASSSSSEKDAYAISDDALTSLRNSRNGRCRGTLPNRSTSNGSNKSGTGGGAGPVNINTNNNNALPSPHQQRASNRSSAGSLWSSLVKNGRRVYGSTASVASSITCTEFDDFNVSDHSLDMRHFGGVEEDEGDGQELVDAQPQIPQRQTSLTPAQHSFSLLSISDHSRQQQQQHLSLSSLGKIDEQPQSSTPELPPPPPPLDHPFRGSANTNNTVSTDLSPKQPGRKVSITDVSVRSSCTGISRTFSNGSSSSNHTKNNNPSSSKVDAQPSHPCRKQSNILTQQDGIIPEEGEEDTSEELKVKELQQQQSASLVEDPKQQ